MSTFLPQRFFLVVAAFLLTALLYVDRACISVAKQPIASELGLSDRQMGWVFSAFSLGYALLQTPAGLLADRWGARRILAAVVGLWSLFTGLTAGAWNFVSMLLVRFLFGAGEAGALPGLARAIFSWIPRQERGLVQGLSFSGMRLGAACTLPLLALGMEWLGWKGLFLLLMAIGFAWALLWYAWFRDDPTQHKRVDREELEYILTHRQQAESNPQSRNLSLARLIGSGNLWLAMAQYFCSNFTFFFCLTWLPPYLKEKHALTAVDAAIFSMWPLLAGALGNIAAGWMVDFIFRRGKFASSRRLPAALGFCLAALGLAGNLQAGSVRAEVAWLAMAILGADMTLPPSWALCMDIGGRHSGAVSGTMNMAGNLGSFLTALAFPYLQSWTGGVQSFFSIAAAFNVLAIILWMFVKPSRTIMEH